MKQLLSINSLVALIVVYALSACSQKYTGNFQNTEKSFQRLAKQHAEKAPKQVNSEEEVAPWSGEIIELKQPVVQQASTAESDHLVLQEIISVQKKKTEALIQSLAVEGKDGTVHQPTKKEVKKVIKKQIKKEMKAAKTEDDANYALMMILGILLAPLAIGITYGIGAEFWISLLLFILFWLPSAIYGAIKIHQHYR